MKAEDLRLGNWYNHNGEYKQVTPNTILELWESERIWIKPIELTEDILLKCGFEKEGEWGIIYFNPRMGIRFYNFNSGECDIIQDDKFIAFKQGHIKYLHQLQNLYFALTQTELIFKP